MDTEEYSNDSELPPMPMLTLLLYRTFGITSRQQNEANATSELTENGLNDSSHQEPTCEQYKPKK